MFISLAYDFNESLCFSLTDILKPIYNNEFMTHTSVYSQSFP